MRFRCFTIFVWIFSIRSHVDCVLDLTSLLVVCRWCFVAIFSSYLPSHEHRPGVVRLGCLRALEKRQISYIVPRLGVMADLPTAIFMKISGRLTIRSLI